MTTRCFRKPRPVTNKKLGRLREEDFTFREAATLMRWFLKATMHKLEMEKTRKEERNV